MLERSNPKGLLPFEVKEKEVIRRVKNMERGNKKEEITTIS